VIGARTAQRNLIFSILAEHIGFFVWTVRSVLVLFMPANRDGFSVGDKFLLTTTPAALGSLVRLPYTFAVAEFGGRDRTVVSVTLPLIITALALFVLRSGVSLTTLLIVTGLAGVGGGNFASSTANIDNFYPQRLKGRALGLKAGGGNIGVATVQILAALIIASAGAATDPPILALYLHSARAPPRRHGLAADGQPHRGEQRRLRAARGRPRPAHPDHLRALHRTSRARSTPRGSARSWDRSSARSAGRWPTGCEARG
jgi:nitrate/nitrite transporter NarK